MVEINLVIVLQKNLSISYQLSNSSATSLYSSFVLYFANIAFKYMTNKQKVNYSQAFELSKLHFIKKL